MAGYPRTAKSQQKVEIIPPFWLKDFLTVDSFHKPRKASRIISHVQRVIDLLVRA